MEKRGREEEQPTKGADQAGHHGATAGAQPCGDELARTGHTPHLFHPGGGSWCMIHQLESPVTAGEPLRLQPQHLQPMSKASGKRSSIGKQCRCRKLETNVNVPIWTGGGDMCCNSHRQFITQTRAIRRVKGSTISNLSGKQARFKMTWANYYA